MRPAIRSHTSKDQDAVSAKTALHCSPADDRARQEFKDSTSIAAILKRHGYMPGQIPPASPLPSGEWNYDLDLHSAHLLLDEASANYRQLPEKLRTEFPTYASFLAALEDGRLVLSHTAPVGSGVSQPLPDGAGGGSGAAPPSA